MTERILIIGVDTPIGLTIVRELGRKGLEVYGVARSDRGVGLFSRWLKEGYILGGDRSIQLKRLIEIIEEERIVAVMAVSEGDLLWLNENRHLLQGVHLLIPDFPQLLAVLDKSRVYSVAKEVGIPLPRMVEPNSPNVAQEMDLRFPVVLKWADPNSVLPLLEKAGLRLEKCQYAYSQTDLEDILKRYEKVGRYPLVQEFCPGYGIGQMFLIHKGEVILYFQHRRVHEWPPEGGFSTLCEPVDSGEHTDLREKSLRMLTSLQWEGVAMVEYRYDPATHKSALMEINGRFWGSLPLAHHAGALFAWEWYRVKVRGEDSAQSKEYSTGFRCAYMFPELKRLFVILFKKQSIQNRSLFFSTPGEILSLFATLSNPRSRYYVFSLLDPMPFAKDILFAIRKYIFSKS